MGLQEYKKKRDFRKTGEPEGKVKKSETGRLFVVQKHAASRLHYDLRLEIDGVLKSWAVPKGPDYDPSEKRLAVHVEDHPIEYGDFEGIIPEGEYGGGTVMLWDQGEWSPQGDPHEGYKKGNLKFTLEGEKLQGGWALIRMKGGGNEKNWLLIKEKDEAADPKKNVTKKKSESVASGRTIEEIRDQRDTVWREGRAEKLEEAVREEKGAKKTSSKVKGKKKKFDPSSLKNAKKRAMPKEFKPQLATLVKQTPEGNKWLHEIKFDGYRILMRLEGGKARLVSRNGKDWTDKFKSIAEAAQGLPLKEAILDGEIVVVLPDGSTDFQALQNYVKKNRNAQLVYYVFDMPWCEGYDLTRSPLVERKILLGQIMDAKSKGPELIRYSDHVEGKGPDFYHNACRHSLEGAISKRADSPYEQKRTRSWVKSKCIKRQEFVIGGYSEPSGSRKGFGALLLGYYEGDDLIYCGRVGTGFNDKTLKTMHEQMSRIERKSAPFKNPPKGREAKDVHWLTPQMVGEVEFTEWTEDGSLRHPAFMGLREDKEVGEVTLETPRPKTAGSTSGKKATQSTSGAKKSSSTSTEEKDETDKGNKKGRSRGNGDVVTIAGITLSNPSRVLYPEQNISKEQLAHFYEKVADWILPHVADRPLTLVRCPRGRQAKCFYQKHINETVPEHVKGFSIKEKSGSSQYLYISDLSGLIALVQMGVLEMHPWGSRVDKVDAPDMLTFDLDPDPSVDWKAIVEGAQQLHDLLEEVGMQSFLKTSGGKGLHLVAPIQRRGDWDEAKSFARAVADEMVRRAPKRYIATMSKAKRKGKIFIDYLRNGRGATSVVAYSTRARQGAPVSTPITWDELKPSLRADQYNVNNLPKRLSSLKSDPWADYFDVRQSITKTMKKKLGMKD